MYDKRVNLICKQIISRNEENEVMSILIKNGHVIDPDSRLDEICDVLIENGRIAKVEKEISDSDRRGRLLCNAGSDRYACAFQRSGPDP